MDRESTRGQKYDRVPLMLRNVGVKLCAYHPTLVSKYLQKYNFFRNFALK